VAIDGDSLMPVEGYVGLPGQGKTLAVVEEGLVALAAGHELYANISLGVRTPGWLVPVCSEGGGPLCSASWRSAATHAGERYDGEDFVSRVGHSIDGAELVPVSAVRSSETRRLYDAVFRRDRGFLVDKGMIPLTGWQQIVAIQQGHDAFGVRHRMALVESGRYDDEGEVVWAARPSCRQWQCGGCSRGVTVIVDEVNQWAPSRYWQKIGMGVLIRWANSRKDGLRIVWTAQHQDRVDKVLREVTDFVWSCKAWGGVASTPFGKFHAQVFTRRKWHPAEMSDKNMVVDAFGATKEGGVVRGFKRYWWLGPFGRLHDVADHYDTFEHVALASHLRVAAEAAPAAVAARSRAPRRIA
jgi:hypothetical protein